MKILKLTIKKKWFDMILSGEKKTEYREIKPYWIWYLQDKNTKYKTFKHYDAIQFYNGAYFSEKLPNFTIELQSIYVGNGVEDWGAEKDKEYFCLCLGNIIN